MTDADTRLAAFLARWQAAGGSERANYQLFIADLCDLLEVAKPDPARDDTRDNAYVFERRVTFRHGDGASSVGFIDCYRRGAFVLEAKKLKAGAETRGFDDALLRARGQAEGYARALPAEEGRPPFLLVVDVGNVIEVYAEFSRTGATYTPFPDPRNHRIRLADLADPGLRQRLKAIWDDPLSLDPTRRTARATREIAVRLARVAQSLEGAYNPESVAGFLSRCLFSMFAEDVGLLPKRDGKGLFTDLLESLRQAPEQFVPLVGELWRAMDTGEFSVAVRTQLPRFNGKLFKAPQVLPLNRDQIDLLLEAARADWGEVEPAIFGTLLERALDPAERHSLGAHYTPRAYVERLVLPTVIEPLRGEWRDIQTAALLLAGQDKLHEAAALARDFHHRLCRLRVLDPACGSGNFLYVTLEHLKRLEGEVLDTLAQLGDTQGRLETEGLSVDPHQFLGLEINPRAAAIAEMVLWIGYLQWHFRTRGAGLPPSPILKDFHNIQCRDAVLAHDGFDYALDEAGLPITRWDGRTTKPHPVTGEAVPDDTARVPLERYRNPRKATWPEADFVVGNPPFIGASTMRQALGDGYVEALRGAWPEVPESADFVMFWWHRAAEQVRAGASRRFGFITTNSLKQTFNRRVVERQLAADPPLALAYAIPDHPWVDSADGAAVRIAMTVGLGMESAWKHMTCNDSVDTPVAYVEPGLLRTVIQEGGADGDAVHVAFVDRRGRIHADLSIGAEVVGAKALRANENLCHMGVKLHGSGFIVTPEEAARLLPATVPPFSKEGSMPADPGGAALIRPYRNGRDLTDRPRGVAVIDLYGLTAEEVRARHPAIYQWVLERVKPERDHNNRASYRDNWWIFGEPRRDLRAALVGLDKYIATTRTAKHRVFQFVPADIVAESKIVCVATDDPFMLGVLSSSVHVIWALAAGGWLGVGNDPTYNHSDCFNKFPFPDPTLAQQARIRALAEELDAHRKRQQAAHPDLTLTGMYNVLDKLRGGEPLTAKDKAIHEAGLVSVLKQIHDDLDAAVLDAYGWSDLFTGGSLDRDALLERLVALNAERTREEAAGRVRWLRPGFQHPAGGTAALDVASGGAAEPAAKATPAGKQAWPASLPAQVRAVAAALAASATPLAEADLAARFTGKGPWKKRLPDILAMLEALGRVRRDGAGWRG